MDKRTTEQLEQRATEIILQEWHEKKDLKELSKIRYFLSIHYKETNMLWHSREWLYNGMRASNTVQKQDKGMAVGKAENEAKAEAEAQYPNRRELNAEAEWINKILDTINGFIINLQVEMKATNQVYTWQ